MSLVRAVSWKGWEPECSVEMYELGKRGQGRQNRFSMELGFEQEETVWSLEGDAASREESFACLLFVKIEEA